MSRGSVAYTVDGGRPGQAEQDPAIWLAALQDAVRDALEGVDVRRIKAMGVSGQQHGLVALDADNHVIRPAKLWCDVESAAEAGAARSSGWSIKTCLLPCLPAAREACLLVSSPHLIHAEELSHLFGFTLVPSFTATKLLWLKRHEPENWARLATVLLPQSYLNLWLTGRTCLEVRGTRQDLFRCPLCCAGALCLCLSLCQQLGSVCIMVSLCRGLAGWGYIRDGAL